MRVYIYVYIYIYVRIYIYIYILYIYAHRLVGLSALLLSLSLAMLRSEDHKTWVVPTVPVQLRLSPCEETSSTQPGRPVLEVLGFRGLRFGLGV